MLADQTCVQSGGMQISLFLPRLNAVFCALLTEGIVLPIAHYINKKDVRR